MKTVKDNKNWLLFDNTKIDKKLKEIFTAEIITESMILDLHELYENKLAKKDKEIKELKQQQLYKEDLEREQLVSY